ncbi:MAG TPA: decarboxylating NADP(+)-dependent phosphogluconate dehydrogenase [Gammaproteobacteria bacterium]|nr:decarboxylating NADP(+)-dependent phosphogluconate dehydrogenase [Chromatiales bacterium]HPQ26176.1 decarboxylating NADP(+)-dependent phosphogluconate dehydrogenase [Gammaproteobacteria bacterium]
MPSDIAVYGLGVMGRNIAHNMVDHGLRVTVYNRTAAVTEAFVEGLPADSTVHASYDLADLADSLARPRVVFLMATAGKVVDLVIDSLLPHLDEGDVIIDGGNSYFQDSQRRWQGLREHGIRFLGMGISGGEDGARHGPSIMPGGDPQAWPLVRDTFQRIAAKADDGEPCCRWVGEGGAGHYVKMIHNGIEYGDMQLIAEAWQLMRDGLGMTASEIAETFAQWNRGVLSSYLIEITAAILRVTDADGTPRVDHILDAAGQKGTGRWTAIDALQLGVPLTLISEAVFARTLSAMKDERVAAAQQLGGVTTGFSGDRAAMLKAIHDALYAAKIISYAQGFLQMRTAAVEYGWQLAFGEIALLWRAGCIIRSGFLDDIKKAFDRRHDLPSLLFDDFFAAALRDAAPGWRKAVTLGVANGIPLPALASALSFYDGYRSATLPANLLQAQRDYFGAHTYRRTDRDPETRWHTHWSSDQTEVAIDD